MSKETFFQSVGQQKCPRCRQGDLFTLKTYDLKHFKEMNLECDKCRQPFFLEPSFYEGAMYVSYAFQVALFITFFVAYQVVYPDAPLWVYISTMVVASVLLIPFTYRFSRTVWLHFFVGYRKEERQKV